MLRTVLTQLALVAAVLAAADPPGHEFVAPTPLDQRSPCPFLNTMANHAFLPRNGFNVSRTQINVAFDQVFNVDPSVTDPITRKSLNGTTSAFPDTINLADLNKHGLIEHDASLSRSDAAVGDNSKFNATVWNNVAQNFVNPTISLQQLSVARNLRIMTARVDNQRLDFNDKSAAANASLAETAFLGIIFANGGTNGGANTTQVDKLFREERLDFAGGYTRPAGRMFPDTVELVGSKINNASSTNIVAKRLNEPKDGFKRIYV